MIVKLVHMSEMMHRSDDGLDEGWNSSP